MDLSDRIIAYITNHHPIPYSRIVGVAAGNGFGEMEVLQALDKVIRNKSISTRVRGGEVYYEPAPPPKTPIDHLKWVREHYPDTTLTAYDQPIPFYDPEYDGPTPVYSKETDKFYREKNEALKRAVDSEKFQRPMVYDRK